MKRWIISLLLFLSLLVLLPKDVGATSGCCSWHGGVCGCDSNVGRQVCCDGTYSPSCGCYSPPRPTPTTIVFPTMTATWQNTPNKDQTFSLSVTLNDPSPSRYSATINKCMGCDPGPLTDFYSNKFTFNNLKAGKHYLNVKKAINGYWSNVFYWKVDIPEWSMPALTPTPTIALIALTQRDDSSNDLIIALVGILVLLAMGVAFIYVICKLIKNFIDYAKENDWVYSIFFWGAIILYWVISLFTSSADNSTKNNSYTTKYTCNCSKTCSNLSCAEAYFQLNSCGCSVRDGDGDGIPCENVCN